MIEVTTAPEAPAVVPAKTSRVWRFVALVVAFQVLAIVAAVVFFSAMGFANDGVGSCGGG